MATDLASTINEGTTQMSEAAKGLATVRQRNKGIQLEAMKQADESFASAAREFRSARTWQDAKKEQDEVTQVNNAATLARATKGNEGVGVALDAVPTRYAKSSQLKWSIGDDATKQLREENLTKIATAKETRAEQDDIDKKAARKSLQQAVKDNPLQDETANAYFSDPASTATLADYLHYRGQEQQTIRAKIAADGRETVEKDKEKARATQQTQKETFLSGEKAKDREQAATLKGKELDIRTRALDIADTKLNASISHENAMQALATWKATFEGTTMRNSMALKSNEDYMRWHHQQLQDNLLAARIVMERNQREGYTADKEERKQLKEQSEETIQTLEHELKTTEALAGKKFQWEEPPPPPEAKPFVRGEKGQDAKAPAGPTPEQIKAAEARGYKPDGAGGWVPSEGK